MFALSDSGVSEFARRFVHQYVRDEVATATRSSPPSAGPQQRSNPLSPSVATSPVAHRRSPAQSPLAGHRMDPAMNHQDFSSPSSVRSGDSDSSRPQADGSVDRPVRTPASPTRFREQARAAFPNISEAELDDIVGPQLLRDPDALGELLSMMTNEHVSVRSSPLRPASPKRSTDRAIPDDLRVSLPSHAALHPPSPVSSPARARPSHVQWWHESPHRVLKRNQMAYARLVQATRQHGLVASDTVDARKSRWHIPSEWQAIQRARRRALEAYRREQQSALFYSGETDHAVQTLRTSERIEYPSLDPMGDAARDEHVRVSEVEHAESERRRINDAIVRSKLGQAAAPFVIGYNRAGVFDGQPLVPISDRSRRVRRRASLTWLSTPRILRGDEPSESRNSRALVRTVLSRTRSLSVDGGSPFFVAESARDGRRGPGLARLADAEQISPPSNALALRDTPTSVVTRATSADRRRPRGGIEARQMGFDHTPDNLQAPRLTLSDAMLAAVHAEPRYAAVETVKLPMSPLTQHASRRTWHSPRAEHALALTEPSSLHHQTTHHPLLPLQQQPPPPPPPPPPPRGSSESLPSMLQGAAQPRSPGRPVRPDRKLPSSTSPAFSASPGLGMQVRKDRDDSAALETGSVSSQVIYAESLYSSRASVASSTRGSSGRRQDAIDLDEVLEGGPLLGPRAAGHAHTVRVPASGLQRLVSALRAVPAPDLASQ